jgi:pilus assembly protein CpaC
MAQQSGFSPNGSSSNSPVRDAVSGTDIDLLVGRSTVINVGAAISRVSLTVPDIADALVTAPSQVLIHGKKPGTISLFIWDRGGAIKTFEVNVRHDLNALKEQLKQLFPVEDITVLASGKDVVLSGTVASKYVVEKAAEVAAGYVAKKEDVVNLLKQQEGVASNQVMLRVRFAEVSRTAVTALGSNFFTGPNGFHDYVAQTSTQQFPQINYEELNRFSEQGPDNWGGGRDTVTATGGKYTFSDLLNIMLFNNRYSIGVLIKALSEKGLFQSLAEPNLIATNGKEASFLAGGEFPYPVVQGGGAGTSSSITIQFKEFGIRLNFTPTVLGGDLIHLKVRPEVSALDFANGVSIEGFRVPALSTRRTETEVELRDGQTFAIAGLMNNQLTDTMRKIPGIGDIPILGWLFKRKAIQKNQTELVVMITPTIIRKGSPGVSENLPSLVEPYLGRPDKTYPNPDPYTGSPRYPADRPKPNEGNGPAAQPRSGGSNEAPQPQPEAEQNAVVPSRPVPQSSTPPPMAPAASSAPVAAEPQPVPMPEPQPAALPQPAEPPAPTKEELRAIERAREQERRAAEAEARQRAEEEKAAAELREQQEKARAEQARREAEAQKAAERKAAEEKRQADRIAKERAKREAEIARKNAEQARKKAEDDQKREKSLNEAAERLKAAQDAYQMELEKAKGGSASEKKDSGTKGSSPAGR